MPKMTYHDRNEREIDSLQAGLRPLARFIMYRLSRIGEDILITDSFRTKQEQAEAYKKGTSHVLFPYSFHNHGAAVDIVPVLFGTFTVSWSWLMTSRFARVASVFTQYGFEWGFSLWGEDKPHQQYSKGKTIHEYIGGFKIDSDEYAGQVIEGLNQEEANLRKALSRTQGRRRDDIAAELAFFSEVKAKILAEFEALV